MAEEIKRLTATEREVLMRLGLAYEFLATDAPMIEARAKMVKNGPAMLRGGLRHDQQIFAGMLQDHLDRPDADADQIV